MTLAIQNNAGNPEGDLLRYLTGRINLEDIAKCIDISASILEPECFDIVCDPLRKGKMPNSKFDSGDADFSLSPLRNLHWCIGEFVFSIPKNISVLKGWEKIYLWFCYWYCEKFTDDEYHDSLIKLLIAAIELNDKALLDLLAQYFQKASEAFSTDRQSDFYDALLVVGVLNLNISNQAEFVPIREYENVCEKILGGDFDSETKALWIDSVKKLQKLSFDDSHIPAVNKSS
jgi:hypothetical protein